jgi:hypothetical protein
MISCLRRSAGTVSCSSPARDEPNGVLSSPIHYRILLPMKPALFAATATFVLPLMVSCGGGTLSLSVLPPVTTLNVNSVGTVYSNFPYVQLQPRLSNGTTPNGVQWTSSAACVPVNKTGQVNCNVTCAGVIESTVVASVDGVSGSGTVTCDYHTTASVEPQPTSERLEVGEPSHASPLDSSPEGSGPP